MLAAKTSLCARVDALGEEVKPTLGIDSRAKVEERLRECERVKVGEASLSSFSSPLPLCYSSLSATQNQWDWEGHGQS